MLCDGGKTARKKPKYLHLDLKAKTDQGQLEKELTSVGLETLCGRHELQMADVRWHC